MAYPIGYFRTFAAEKLEFERFQHTIGVEVLAVKLAKRYGIDVEAATLAALTHDMAKAYSQQEQLTKAKEWNLITFPEDLENPQVIHGRVAAYILENEYIGCHPCVNTSSLKIKTSDIMKIFLPYTGHEPVIVDL